MIAYQRNNLSAFSDVISVMCFNIYLPDKGNLFSDIPHQGWLIPLAAVRMGSQERRIRLNQKELLRDTGSHLSEPVRFFVSYWTGNTDPKIQLVGV